MTVHRDLRLVPVSDTLAADEPAVGGLVGDTEPERRAAHDYLLGALIEHHVQDAVDQCGGRGTTAQRRELYREARRLVLERATTFEGLDPEVDRARAVGRGEGAQ